MIINVQVDLAGAQAVLESPERLRRGLADGIRAATQAVWEDATDRSNYGVVQGPMGHLSYRMPRNDSDRLRIVTGTLVDSINQDFVAVSDREFQGEVGSALAYAGIHEHGGYAGRNHATYIPPRPYLGPALERQRARVVELVQSCIDNALVTR